MSRSYEQARADLKACAETASTLETQKHIDGTGEALRFARLMLTRAASHYVAVVKALDEEQKAAASV